MGTRTDQNATDSWTLYPSDAVFAHIDMDSGEVGRNYEAIRLVGDARLTLEALADVMKTMDGGKRRTARAALEARIAAGRAAHDAEMASFLSNAGEPLHPAQVMAALQAVLTPESIVVADASFSSIWATNNLVSLRSGMRFITPRAWPGSAGACRWRWVPPSPNRKPPSTALPATAGLRMSGRRWKSRPVPTSK